MEFRRDINGLRAIAVALVVLFHFGVPGFQGGFIGVDVFFVISGYLMTGIIFSRMRKETFTILGFYLDRARRIVPALACLCFVVLLVGWALLLPVNYVELGKQVLGSLAFVSNFLYSQEAGYFEQAAHEKWLLHTWSLSVEWQFYLLYPLALVALRLFVPIDKLRWFILAAAILSLAISVYASSRWPIHAYFLLPTRAWEMLAGALVFLFPLRRMHTGKVSWEWVGIGLILFSAVFFSSQLDWPGAFAVLPVLGTALIILQARQDSIITSNSVSTFLGKTSYSVYLWHWPVVVWINYFGLGGEAAWMVLGIAASILLGYLSYRFIENMARQRRSRPARAAHTSRPLVHIGVPTTAAAVFGMAIIISNGVSQRMSEDFYAAMGRLDLPRMNNGWCFYDVNSDEDLAVGSEGLRCVRGERGAPLKGLLFGDSFAGHYGPFWDRVGKDISAEINSVTTNWCYPSTNDVIYGDSSTRSYDQCLINRQYFLENVSNYDFVVLSGSWRNIYTSDQMQGVYDAIVYAAQRTRLVIVMPTPTYFDVNVKNIYARSMLFNIDFDISHFAKTGDAEAVEANRAVEAFAEQHANVVYIDREALFNVDGLPSEVTAENIPFNYDENGHISIYGSKMAAESFTSSSSYRELSRQLREVRNAKARLKPKPDPKPKELVTQWLSNWDMANSAVITW
ncbi:peptidoglycan/LPS O-acetylase OafA/YrhL [Modicisalibacter xianhensis]|uniref:Peptidoglycan/LPS O-acetylase OafA/YrhL n=1 Tax=Modicisalibacter xianhensis TaxID=442341 RepID=A0A4R8FSN1_9GAMM|nr:acyltransferase family protein [Halomonas xianhensis]TDX26945.1 peptidoglycan/LPS O-acetylase OafA/YrhL [Halomonas xianhensis]